MLLVFLFTVTHRHLPKVDWHSVKAAFCLPHGNESDYIEQLAGRTDGEAALASGSNTLLYSLVHNFLSLDYSTKLIYYTLCF